MTTLVLTILFCFAFGVFLHMRLQIRRFHRRFPDHKYQLPCPGGTIILTIPKTMQQRMQGLRSHNLSYQGMLFPPMTTVTTLGMKVPIDLVFFNQDMVITHVLEAVAPGKFWVPGPLDAVAELPAGSVRALGARAGSPFALRSPCSM